MDLVNKIEIEMKIISTMLHSPTSAEYAAHRLTKNHFGVKDSQEIFKAVRFIVDQGNEPTELAIKSVLTKFLNYHSMDVQEMMDTYNFDPEPSNVSMYIGMLETAVAHDSLHKLGDELIKMCTDEREIVEIIKHIEKATSVVNPVLMDNLVLDINEAVKETMYDIEHNGSNGHVVYKINSKGFDNLVGFYPGDIMLLGGKAGSFKTKYTIHLISKLLARYSDISVLWYAMEDPAAKIIRGFLSQELHLTDKELRNVGYKLNEKEKEKINQMTADIVQYDIRFVNKSAYIEDIGNDFKLFRKERPDKFNILIIDNVMKLSDHKKFRTQVQSDDFISLTIDSWNIKTERGKNMIIFLHHFTDEQLEKSNINDGYRPREKHLKGSTRYRDIATQILLANNPGNYPDLVSRFIDYELLLKKLFLVDVTKNRNGDTGFLRYFALPEYNMFKLLEH